MTSGNRLQAKRCSKCSEWKLLSDFGPSGSARGGLRSQCKECCRNYQRIKSAAFKAENGCWPRDSYVYAHTCETCGKTRTGRQPETRFCSGTCANNARTYRLTCRVCRTEWDAGSPQALWCSKECRRFGERGSAAQVALWERPEGWVHPRYLTTITVPRPLRRRWYAGQCAHCREWFIHDQPQTSTCSPRCAGKLSKAKRRAVKKAAYVAPVSPRKIYERDKWRCQLCGERVKRNAVVPHPLAPVPDHVVPLAAGGTHEPANVQCAHYLCNCRKGAGGGGEQLLLIG